VFGQGIADIGSGLMKSGSDVIRGVQQATGLGDDEVLREAQSQHDSEFNKVRSRSPFLSAVGEAAPLALTKGNIPTMAGQAALLELLKYGSLGERGQNAAEAGVTTLAIPAAAKLTGMAASKLNMPFKSSNDVNLKAMKEWADKAGIPLNLAQRSGNKSLQALDSILSDFPLTSTKQAEKYAGQRESWQKKLFTEGGENVPWSYTTRVPGSADISADDMSKYMRTKITPEATYEGKTYGVSDGKGTDLTTNVSSGVLSTRSGVPAEQGFMEAYSKALPPPKGKELSVPQSLKKYDYEPEYIGGYAKGASKEELKDIEDAVFREASDPSTSTFNVDITPGSRITNDMPASDAVHPTPDVMAGMKYRLNTLYNDVHSNNSLTVDKRFHDALGRISREYVQGDLPSDIKKLALVKIHELRSVPEGGKIPGKVYQNIRSKLDGYMSTYQNDSTAHEAFKKIREALDNKMYSGLNDIDKAKLDAANKGWMTMRTIEDAVDSNQGTIDPKKFFTSLVKKDANKNRTVYGKGEQDLTELAKVGTHFIQPKKDVVSAWAKYPWVKGIGSAGGLGALAYYAKDNPGLVGSAGIGTLLGAAGINKLQNMMWQPKSFLVDGAIKKELPKLKKVGKGIGKVAPIASYIEYLMEQEKQNGR
jgi:hypothetical protein